jgi:hypothetical protein
MNSFDESSSDDAEDAGFARPVELEMSLLKLRPRAPKIDVESLLANAAAPNSAPADAAHGDVPCLPAENNSVHGVGTSSPLRTWLIVVGASSCGAIVGGLVVFLLMQQRSASPHPSTNPNQSLGVVSIRQPVSTDADRIQQDPPNEDSINLPLPDHAVGVDVIAATASHWQSDDWAAILDDDSTGLMAGSHLGQFLDRVAEDDGEFTRLSIAPKRLPEPLHDRNAGDSGPDVTRAWLLEKLLGDSPRTL